MKKEREISRRGFLKAAAAVGAALTIQPAMNKVKAAEAALGGRGATVAGESGMPHRTLGTGSAAMEVSALGFGVMGMNYNRSQSPDRKECIRLLHEAVDRGVTLFDTAIIYGPLRNELLAGEALAPYKGRVSVTTKFGHEVIDGRATGGRTAAAPRCAATARSPCAACASTPSRSSVSTATTRARPSRKWRRPSANSSRKARCNAGACARSARTPSGGHMPCSRSQPYRASTTSCTAKWRRTACSTRAGSWASASFPTVRSTGDSSEAASTNTPCSTPTNDNRHTLPRFQPEAIRANTRIVSALQQFGRTRGMTSAQVSLGWLLQKAPWTVPHSRNHEAVPHLEENLHALAFSVKPEEWKELEEAVAAIPVAGSRYNAEQQRQVGH